MPEKQIFGKVMLEKSFENDETQFNFTIYKIALGVQIRKHHPAPT